MERIHSSLRQLLIRSQLLDGARRSVRASSAVLVLKHTSGTIKSAGRSFNQHAARSARMQCLTISVGKVVGWTTCTGEQEADMAVARIEVGPIRFHSASTEDCRAADRQEGPDSGIASGEYSIDG